MFEREALAYTIDPGALHLSGFSDLGGLISAILPVIVSVSGLALFAYLLMGGLKYITSGGDEKAVMEARKIITNALVGMMIVFVAFFIIRILEVVLGLEITGY